MSSTHNKVNSDAGIVMLDNMKLTKFLIFDSQ